jgi:AcrR family transcriptional regulator
MSRLNRDDWSKAALSVIGEQGVAGLAVEPLAAQLGATKGSFYWHFKSRDELVGAALELWEQRSTTAVIEQVESADADPRSSLRTLFDLAFDEDALAGADVALLANHDDARVREAVERVTRRRIDYIADLLGRAGARPTGARRRAVFAYCAFLGHLQLRRHAPGFVREQTGEPAAHIDEVLRMLLD